MQPSAWGASASMSKGSSNPDLVVVHPLVLLSVVDHYNRVAKDTRKRVVGVLLGEVTKGRTDVTNAFAGAATMTLIPAPCCLPVVHPVIWDMVIAVPFEEDERDPSIWFLDHSFLENMAAMYKRVNGGSTNSMPSASILRVVPPALTAVAVLYTICSSLIKQHDHSTRVATPCHALSPYPLTQHGRRWWDGTIPARGYERRTWTSVR